MSETRDGRGRFLPGVANNPGGRPKNALSLTGIARAKVSKDELVDIFMAIARGEPLVRTLDTATGTPMPASSAPEGAKVTEVIWPDTGHRLRAAEFLWDKIEPPVKQSKVQVEVGGAGASGADFSQLSDEELDQFLALQEKARKKVEAEDAEFVDVPAQGALPPGEPEPTE